jgi:archaellum component FlaF (FlaF/FlaG flagellin family)
MLTAAIVAISVLVGACLLYVFLLNIYMNGTHISDS